MVAPAGKQPAYKLSASDKKKIEDQRRRERRLRRSKDPPVRRLPSIKIRTALAKKAAAQEAEEEDADASDDGKEHQKDVSAGKRKATTKGNVKKTVARGKASKTKKAEGAKVTGEVVEGESGAIDEANMVVRSTLDRLLDDLGDDDSSDEGGDEVVEHDAPPTSDPTSSEVVQNPPTSAPTSEAAVAEPPISRPTSPTTSGRPPTSTPALTAVPTSSRPRSCLGKRKKRSVTQSEDSSNEEECVDELSNSDEQIGGDDPCFDGVGEAVKDTLLDSESEGSSSEIGENDVELEDSEGDMWELVSPSDDEDDAAEQLPDSEFLRTATNKSLMKDMRNTGWEYDPAKFGPDPTYDGLYEGPYGPSDAVMRIAEDPLALFFFFMPPQLWRQIQRETNLYHKQNIEKRVAEIRKAQRKANRDDVEAKKDVRARLRAVACVEPYEILRVIGLLIARMLCPYAKGLSGHWRKSQHGAVPVGTFGQWLSRNRFDHVMQNLHFTSNTSPQARVDRGWKVRSVVSTLQKTFARGYNVGPVIAFDEAIIPTRSRRNPTRQYLPQKPHKWGTKFFAACCGDTAYCMRIELYVGTKTHLSVPPCADNSCGAAAVIRNMDALVPRSPSSPFRLVITDRYYSSVVLALELLHRRMYFTGTIQTRRAGYAAGVITKKKVSKKTPSDPARGTVKLAENKTFPQITAVMWMDNTPVHMLSTGGSRALVPVYRKVGAERQNFPAPGLVRDYQKWMGGVDIHDQLRMQRYSIQLAYKPKKYYRSIFFGLTDMAVVNAFIVHRYYMKLTNQKAPDHYKFMETLHEQLLAIDDEKFKEIEAATRAEDRTAASPATTSAMGGTNGDEHYLAECPDFVDSKKGRKRVARTCKVCTVYQVLPRKFSKWYCPGCSVDTLRKHLCNVARPGREKTCHQIWHEDWNNGLNIPERLLNGRRVQDRRPGRKRPRTRRRVDMEEAKTGGGGEESSGDDE